MKTKKKNRKAAKRPQQRVGRALVLRLEWRAEDKHTLAAQLHTIAEEIKQGTPWASSIRGQWEINDILRHERGAHTK